MFGEKPILTRLSTSEIELGPHILLLEKDKKHDGLLDCRKVPCPLLSLWPVFVASLLLATSIGFYVAALLRTPNDLECALRLSPYCKNFFIHHLVSAQFVHLLTANDTPRTAPMLEAVEYEEVNWVNDFDQPSIYRGYPSPEREKAWNTLWQRSSPTFRSCNPNRPILSCRWHCERSRKGIRVPQPLEACRLHANTGQIRPWSRGRGRGLSSVALSGQSSRFHFFS